MEAEHFLLNCCSQHSLFIVEIGKVRISFYDVSNIHILLCSELVNEGYRFHENVLVCVSTLFLQGYEFVL